MRRRHSWMLVWAFALVLGMAIPAGAAADGEIAVFACLSGPAVDLGVMSRDGVTLAVEDVNQAGGIKALGGAKGKMVVADVTRNVAQAPGVVERILSTQKISGAVGMGMSQMTLSCLPVLEKAQVPLTTSSI